eukprot:3553710-Alexandrium_andersonii.AAC.1
MGFLPARAMRSEIGRTPRTRHDSMRRVPSARADATSSGPRAAPVMSSRYVCPPGPAPRPSEDSGTAEAVSESAARKL